MAVNFYDDAFLEKLEKWTDKTNMHVYGPDDTRRLIEVIADETSDSNIKLPILCLRRTGGYEILNPNKKPLTFDGMLISNEGGWRLSYMPPDSSELVSEMFASFDVAIKKAELLEQEGYTDIDVSEVDGTRAIKLNAIPINITYQLDIYTRYLKEADEYMRNLIFNIVNYPTLQVTIPYNSANIVHNANIRTTNIVEDNSAVPERLVTGQFTRLSLTVTIDDAYLWDAKVRNNICICDTDVIVVNT